MLVIQANVLWCGLQAFTADFSTVGLDGGPRSLVLVFYLFYVLFAIVVINLFIALVTDVYPKVWMQVVEICWVFVADACARAVCDLGFQAREKSQNEWEKFITAIMEVWMQLAHWFGTAAIEALTHLLLLCRTMWRHSTFQHPRRGLGALCTTCLGVPIRW